MSIQQTKMKHASTRKGNQHDSYNTNSDMPYKTYLSKNPNRKTLEKEKSTCPTPAKQLFKSIRWLALDVFSIRL